MIPYNFDICGAVKNKEPKIVARYWIADLIQECDLVSYEKSSIYSNLYIRIDKKMNGKACAELPGF